MSPADRFLVSCQNADQFPNNLVARGIFDYNLDDYRERLDQRQHDLFSSEDDGLLEFWEYSDEEQGMLPVFREEATYGIGELQRHLSTPSYDTCDPRCRFIFVLAPHSRERLCTSRKMLMYAFTYHQIMPAFLDFIFPFGQQVYVQDFYFSGFRRENLSADADTGIKLPKLGRSGREIRMCYSLKSVEQSEEPEQTWSIRQTATYHSFDVVSGSALWISVKGNDLIKDRVMSATEHIKPNERPFATKAGAFARSLDVHWMNCKWASEEWRWYLNFLEEDIQSNTRRTLSTQVVRRRPEDDEAVKFLKDRTRTASGRETANNGPMNLSNHLQPPQSRPIQTRHPLSKHFNTEPHVQDYFSFSDMQRLQSWEEKINEAVFVLTANVDVVRELAENYRSLVTSVESLEYFEMDQKKATESFEKQVMSIIRDMQVQIARAKTLIRLLADRKALVGCTYEPIEKFRAHTNSKQLYGILEYRNMQANKSIAEKAQQSTDNMENMTENMEGLTKQMHRLAKRATQEAVSMRIITLVTLFFLPGTFISVSSLSTSFCWRKQYRVLSRGQMLKSGQTIMSTDIVKFQSTAGGPGPIVFQRAALSLYLYVTIPLMVVTFTTWWGLYRCEQYKAKKSERKSKNRDAEKGTGNGLNARL
ncbi:hypothetical protein BP5796_04258 [Coleophoma crateriformis]|uniref:CorA-like transporter domain-containing protein n=1 Tax=Coleophoma crateriformis TaxID=565419 RepID=A0A3D8SI17_9HELO|nr:hypothetical protein BP5796_04258 [Coleophoma crateriformis]